MEPSPGLNKSTTNPFIHRAAVGSLFFIQGLSFASWASRIPTIQQKLELNETQLGFVLLALPVGLLTSLPISGFLVSKLGSRKIVLIASVAYSIFLISIGLTTNITQIMAALFFFGLVGNMVNISVNTQAVGVEAIYKRPIMASFHGLWSLAGFTGAAIGTFMIARNIIPFYHFLSAAIIAIIVLAISARYTLQEDHNSENKSKIFVIPDKSLLFLGLITFSGMICEGAMFDWSGIYFQKVVRPSKDWIGAGYTAFMLTMASGRFIADWFAHKFGLKATLQLSGTLIAAGLMLAVIFPSLATALTGFLLVGFGVSSVVPLVYSSAGRSKAMSPGVAIAAVSTIGFFGFLLGPPLIGFIAGIINLRASFTLIAVMGLSVAVLSSFIRKD